MGTNSKVFRAALHLGLLTALASGCGDSAVEDVEKKEGFTYCDNVDAPAPTCLEPSFDVEAKLSSCADSNCHGVGNVGFSWALDLSNGPESALADLIGVQSDIGAGDLIDSANIDCSHMLSKVVAKDAPLVSGSVMPLAPEPAWTAGEVDCFRKFLHDNLAN